jgi:ABC-type multidrug transport system fused ATPase/permease subunit
MELKFMCNVKKVSKKVGFTIIFFVLLVGAALAVSAYFGVTKLIQEIGPILQSNVDPVAAKDVWNLVLEYYPKFWYTLFPAVMIFSLIVGILAWLIARSSIKKLALSAEEPVEEADAGSGKTEKDLSDRRLFLHLFSLMQQEGRLMDFLNEDLDQYDDAQIGSAVRSIHAGCRQLVQEYLNPEPVLDQHEGAVVEVPVDFDPGVIKLTGNVVGEPPFNGILRHKGWQVGKMNLPTLSGRQNAEIIAPAEVEIT